MFGHDLSPAVSGIMLVILASGWLEHALTINVDKVFASFFSMELHLLNASYGPCHRLSRYFKVKKPELSQVGLCACLVDTSNGACALVLSMQGHFRVCKEK